MITSTRSLRWVAPVFAAGLIVAGCSKTADSTATTGSGSTTPSTAAASSTTYGAGGDTDASTTAKPGSTAASSSSADFTLAKTSLGTILVDSKGMTVYAFKKDTATTSACTDACATAWPPVVVGTVAPGPGLEAASFTTLTRADGGKQVVYLGHPLYHFAADTKAGDLGGQGVGGNWYVIGADGNTITTKAP